jgi:hypothetical protein
MRARITSRQPAVIGWPGALLACATLAALSACSDKSSRQSNGEPAREIQLAPSSSAQPQLNDAPPPAPAPAPVPPPRHVARAPVPPPEVIVHKLPPPVPDTVVETPMPAPAAAAPVAAPAAPPAPTVGTVETGALIVVHPIARVCTNSFKAGDRFTALVSSQVNGSNGAIIPAGSSVVLKVVESTRSENSKDAGRLVFTPVSIRVGDQSYDLTGHVMATAPLERVRTQSTGDQAKKVGAGAVIGALAGQLLGHNTRSTIAGGAIGAAAGAAVAAGTADYDLCVAPSALLSVGLDEPLRIRLLPN